MSDQANHSHTELESDKLKLGILAVAIAAICLLIVALVDFADQYFDVRVEEEQHTKVGERDRGWMTELHQNEAKKLANAAPAIDQVVADYQKPLEELKLPAAAAPDGGVAPATPAKEGEPKAAEPKAGDKPAEAKPADAKAVEKTDAKKTEPAVEKKAEKAPAEKKIEKAPADKKADDKKAESPAKESAK